ncbi:MAG TPA: hypothetical protein VKZ49_18460, partial [Polyangiaceae bacterium]|nr:hypothetical protein [Polyangiaceae bacterium]
QVRRVAKQTARAVGEQAAALRGITANNVRQGESLRQLIQVVGEQRGATGELEASLSEARDRARMVIGATSEVEEGVERLTQEVQQVQKLASEPPPPGEPWATEPRE